MAGNRHRHQVVTQLLVVAVATSQINEKAQEEAGEMKQRVVIAAAIWASAVAMLSLALISGENAAAAGRGVAPVALSAFFPGDDYLTDLQDDQQVAPLEDPSMPNGDGEYIGMGDGEDDDEIQNLSDNPAMTHVATGRVFEVQRQVFAPPQWERRNM